MEALVLIGPFAHLLTQSIAPWLARSIVTCSAGVRSEHGATRRSWKLIAAIQRREFVPRDPSDGIESDGACRDGRRAKRVLLAARTKEYERRAISRRAERTPDERVTIAQWTRRV